MGLKDIELESVDWIDLEKDREMQQVLLNTGMNNWVEDCWKN